MLFGGAQALQDRFIPTRSAMDLDVAHYSLTSTENDAPANSTAELLSPQKVRGSLCNIPSLEVGRNLPPPPCFHSVQTRSPTSHKMTMHPQLSQIEYQKRLAEGLSTDGSARILAFKNKVPALIAVLVITSEQPPLLPSRA